MGTFKIAKVLAALPDPLEANTVYAVRVGAGFDLYFTDNTGLIAYKQNAPVDAGIIVANEYTADHTAGAADAGAEAQMNAATALTFTIDPTTLAAGSAGIVRQTGAGSATIAVASGTLVKGGPTAKTAQKGSALSWRVQSSGLVYVNGECAAT